MDIRRHFTTYLKLGVFTFALAIFLLPWESARAQVNVSLVVTSASVSNSTDCDGFCVGDNDYIWWWSTPGFNDPFDAVQEECYSQNNCNGCTSNNGLSITIINENYDCLADVPGSFQVEFDACENDNQICEAVIGCTLGTSLAICDGNSAGTITNTFNVPAGNGTFTGTICTSGGSDCNWKNWCYGYTFTRSGSFLGQGNDFICDAGVPNLGTINIGGSLGNESNYIYNNFCSTPDNPTGGWSSDQGVWFSFQTGSQVGTNLTLEIEGNGLDIFLGGAVYLTPSGACNGQLVEVANSDDPIDIIYSETIEIQCPRPNSTYYILVGGISNPLDFLNAFDEEHGWFGIGIYDDGAAQAADYICDAENLGTPTPGGVTTNVPTQSNICATQDIAANGNNDPIPGADWSTATDEQQGVWYQFTAPASGSVNINVNSTADILNIIDPNDLDAYVAVYTTTDGTCSGVLDFVAQQHSLLTPCGLDFSPNDSYDESLDVYCLEPGDPYWIFIDGDENLSLLNDGVYGYFSITVSDIGHYPAPNDDVCNATVINGGAQLAPNQTVTLTNQSNHCASNEVEPDGFGWSNEQGVWYEFVAPPSGAVEIWGRNNFEYYCPFPVPVYEDAIRVELAVFGAPGGITCGGSPSQNQNDENLFVVHAESDAGPFSNDVIEGGIAIDDELNDEYMFVECLTPGETYYIMVDGNGTGILAADFIEGIFSLEIHAVDQPAPTGNDTPCEAIALGDPTGTTSGSPMISPIYNNYCATTDPTDPAIEGLFGEPGLQQTVWFTFTAPSTGSVIVEALNNGIDDIDLQVGVYQSSTGDCTGEMYDLMSDYDPIIFDEELPEIYCLEPGETYYIMVDGVDEPILDFWHEGDFQISIYEIPPIPPQPNDDICNATLFPADPFTNGQQTLVDQDNRCAQDWNDPDPEAFDTDHTVWYEFTTPAAAGTYGVEIVATSDLFWPFGTDAVDLQLAVFGSDNNACDGNLYEVASDWDVLDFDLGFYPFNEALEVQCLEPASTYYIMVDGSFINLQGFFDISIEPIVANPAAPNNDICEFIDLGAVPVGGSIPPGTDYYNFCADVQPGEPDPSAFGLDQTVWFTFTAPNTPGANASSSITINLTSDPNNVGDEIDLQFAVYESSSDCNGTLTEIDSDYDPFFYDETMSLTCLVPGQTYYMQVDGADNLIGGIEGYFHIEIIDDGGGQFPTNDDLCDAYALGSVPNGGTLNGGNFSNLCATIEPGEPDPGFGLGLDDIDQTVWFTFSPPTSGNVLIDANSLSGDNVDLQLAVYYSADGSCDPGQMVPINHEWDGLGLAWDEDLLVTCLDPSVTYYLQVDGSSITEDLQGGNFSLTLIDDGGSTTIPYNNDICNAYDFGTVPNSETLPNETNICADVELGEPGIFDYAQNTVWYQFTAPESGRIDIIIDPASILDLYPEVHLFSSSTGDCTGSFTEIDSDIVPDINGDAVISTPCIVPGETYFIQVDGQLIAPQGDFAITLTNPEPNYGTGGAGDVEPANNDCIDAIPLAVQDESCFVGDGIFDVENYGYPTISVNNAYVQGCNGNGNCGDTWYCFTMPQSGAALIEGNDDEIGGLFGDYSDVTIIAYTGDCTSLSPLECGAGGLGTDVSYEVAAEPGSKVWLQVFDGGGDDHGENFEICVSEQCGADNCLNAITMEPDVPYCWSTASATGENLSNTPGYAECGDATDPEHSIYFTFTTDCAGSTVTLSLFDIVYDDNNPLYIPCDGFGLPEDGFTYTLFADSTPCDNNPDDIVSCEVVSGCDYNSANTSYEFEYTGLNPNTQYVVQIDGGFYNLFGGEVGGNVEGQIMITVEGQPEIDAMVIIQPIACYGEQAWITAAVSGGTPPFDFVWTDSVGTNVVTDQINMMAENGWNYVTVTDPVSGCVVTDSVYVEEPAPFSVSMEYDPTILCYGTDGTATIHPEGGTPDYNFLWSNGEIDSLATMLSPGLNTVTVTDANGCTSTATVTFEEGDIQFIRN